MPPISRTMLTIAEAHDGLRRRAFSVTELVSECLAAIGRENKALNAYLDVFAEDALAAARSCDDALADPAFMPPPLFGIPVAVKDNIVVAGKRATAGSKILERYVAPYDATAITRLREHGAIFLGKTNLDEFAMGSSTENSAFGPTANPHDRERVAGGSSGGSAAAVAAGLALAALGSDTGGSIRQPASFCGVVGFKPTYGSVSRHGLIAMASSLDQIGPFTRSVADAALVFDAIRGEDALDATSMPGAAHPANAQEGLRGVRVGVPKEYFLDGLDANVRAAAETAIKKMEAAGAELREITLPHSPLALPAYYIIVPSEISANLARYDGIRYGHHAAEAATLFDVFAKTRREGFGTETKRRVMLGTYALSAGYYDAYYLKAQKVRRLVKNDFDAAFKNVDVIAGPTTPTAAFRRGEHAADPVAMYLADIYTVGVNLAGLPALSLPAGFVDADGARLPAGLHLVGQRNRDDALLAIAAATESVLTSR